MFSSLRFGCSTQPSKCISADITIDSYSATDLGALHGKVTRIGSVALAPDPQEQRQELSCPVTVQLTQQQLRMKSGGKLTFLVGMSFRANIKLRQVSCLQFLLGEFQDKAASLQRLL